MYDLFVICVVMNLCCKQLYKNSLDNFVLLNLVSNHTIFGNLPQEIYENIQKYILQDQKPCCFDKFKTVAKCNVCSVKICDTHMNRWVCYACELEILCEDCHKKDHTGHARWSDIPYEI